MSFKLQGENMKIKEVLVLLVLTLIGIFSVVALASNVYVTFYLNASEPITLTYDPLLSPYGFLTIDQSNIVIVQANQTLFIESQYPFAVNGTVAKHFGHYIFGIPTNKNTVVYVDFLPNPPPKNVYVVDLNEFKSSYAFIDFHLNETKNITIWLSTDFLGSSPSLYMPYTTINSSTKVPVLKDYTVVITSEYPFEVNGTFAKFDYYSYNYTYSFFVSGNTTVNINFVSHMPQTTVITPSYHQIAHNVITQPRKSYAFPLIITVLILAIISIIVVNRKKQI